MFKKKAIPSNQSIPQLINTTAVDWAAKNAGSTYSGITDDQRQAIQDAVTQFVTTPGFTLGKVVKLLSTHFDQEKAQLIAETEITRAYAFAAQIEGEKKKIKYPDVRVIKTWTTNNDDRVCPTCKSLHGSVVEISDFFTVGVFIPPAHAGCRCSISSRTDISGSKKLQLEMKK